MHSRRIRNDREQCFYHCFNRASGWQGDSFFGAVEKEKLFKLAVWLQKFYSIEIISFVCMSNHWHALVCTYPEKPGRMEVARRFRDFYGHTQPEPDWDDPTVVDKYASRMRDMSCFIKDLQQRFTCWFNRTTGHRGRLWGDRYKSVVLDGNHALWECLKYIEMNAVRAGYCEDPADYRFCTWGRYCASGHHPFARAFEKHLAHYHADKGNDLRFKEVATILHTELARVSAAERGEGPEDIQSAQKKAAQGVPFDLKVKRRVRYWSDGAIIGSEEFVRRFATKFFGDKYMGNGKRLARSAPQSSYGFSLFSFRCLQKIE